MEKLSFQPAILAKIPKSYIRCTESVFAMVGEIAKAKIMSRIKEDNWTYLEIPSDHTPMISMPEALLDFL